MQSPIFRCNGFVLDEWEFMRDSLLDHARTASIIEVRHKKHGMAYALRGKLMSPDARNPIIISVWQIDIDNDAPRFITAYPDV